ncbi:HlyC/CorC family transporter [Rhodobacteraceae bacterium 63075]|nr:HlyC/CorC family transporter [Rhodobacteraceae bacterium 63075]
MGERTDGNEGSSGAAQSARTEDDTQDIAGQGETTSGKTAASPAEDESGQGFFGRIIAALSPTEEDPDGSADRLHAENAQTSYGVLNLRRMAVEDVMVPSADITAVPSTTSKEDLVKVFRESGLTRLPVYEETLDTPAGMVHLKDFALKHGFNGTAKERFCLSGLLRPLMYVPPSMPIGVLLTKMQTERKHMALVIDEYGGVDGLVTIEDLIEQVVGEIEDEHDTEEDAYFTPDKQGGYLALAKTPLDEFESETGLKLTEAHEVDGEEVDTLGGLVFMLTGRVPVRGEVVKHPGGAEFEVVDADPRRIKRLRVRLPGQAAPKPPAPAASASAPQEPGPDDTA